MPPSRTAGIKPLFPHRDDSHRENPPEQYLIAHSDGGARGNPGPAGYGVVIQDQSGRKVAQLSEYLGHQTNNFAEYQGLIAALEYALKHGPKALKLISDSELLVRQIKGIYKVKNATLKDLHGRAKELIAQLEWFSIGHALREHNREADRLANEAMDKGVGKSVTTDHMARALLPANADVGNNPEGNAGRMRSEGRTTIAVQGSPATNPAQQELEGVIRNGVVELTNGKLLEGTRVQVRTKR
jgi:ribonuclease HI